MGDWQQRTHLWLRLPLMMCSILAFILGLAVPQWQGQSFDWNDERLKTEDILPGDELIQPISIFGSFNQLSLRVEAIRDAKDMTLELDLRNAKNETIACQSYSLRKVRAKGKLIMNLPVMRSGEYQLIVRASGQGSTKLGAGKMYTMQHNGEPQQLGCAVRLNVVEKVYSRAMLFMAVLFCLLALIPVGEGAVKRRA